MADRKFNDKEVGEILKAAAEMQAGMLSSSSEGLTLQELQAVANEIGIDANHIDRAAQEITPSPQTREVSQSDALSVERNVQGELTEESWQDLVVEMQTLTGQAGKIISRGDTQEWIGGTDLGSFVLSVTSRRGRTRFKLLGNSSGYTAMSGVFGFVAGVFLVLAPVIYSVKHHPSPESWVTLLMSIGMALTCILGVKLSVRRNRVRFQSKLESIVGTLVNSFGQNQATMLTRRLSSQHQSLESEETHQSIRS